MEPNKIRLTQTVQKGGCAAKVAAQELRSLLQSVEFPPQDSNLLVDGSLFDDAAIYKIHDDLALVQTIDFFTPILDTPYLFGKVAAANALSDVYAMGGEPKTAMAVLAFPLATLDKEVIAQVLQGGCDVMKEACVNFVGGHSIDDDTLKFGLSVTGFVHPQKVFSNSKAKVGDILILTKALGTGTLTAGLKKSAFDEKDMLDAIESMTQINKIYDLLTQEEWDHIHAATDITGFGLCGHSYQMAKASNVTFKFDVSQIPVFDGVRKSLKAGHLTKAHRTNKEYVQGQCQMEKLSLEESQILCDPQTSGGLLLSVDAKFAHVILEKLKSRFSKTSFVGQVQPKNLYWCHFR